MSKILIIGGASGIGASLASSLLQNTQHSLITVDDLRVESDLRNLQFALSHKKGDRHKFYLSSVNDPHISDKLFELERPDWVVFCKTPEKTAYHQSLVRILLSASKYGSKTLYIKPDSWSNERNESYVYGEEICKSDSNTNIVRILHTCRIFGPRQEAGDILTDAMCRIAAGKWPGVSTASNRPREWLYIKDLLVAIEGILNSDAVPGEYYASSGQIASEHEAMMCLQMISEGRGFEFAKYDIKTIDCSSLNQFGWSPKYTMRDALEHTLAWYSINTWAANMVVHDSK